MSHPGLSWPTPNYYLHNKQLPQNFQVLGKYFLSTWKYFSKYLEFSPHSGATSFTTAHSKKHIPAQHTKGTYETYAAPPTPTTSYPIYYGC